MNNVGAIYPNYSESLLSGNLLIGSKEGDGDFNTNLVTIKDPSWSGLDRYFLNISRRNVQDLSKLTRFVEDTIFSKNSKSSLTGTTFFQNSDHSDMNRWLKRGWGLSEPIRLIKSTEIGDSSNTELLRFRFNEKNNSVVGKSTNNVYLAFKQKRYVIRKKFPIKKRFKRLITNEPSTESVSKEKLRLKVLVKNNYFKTISEKEALLDYKFLKKAKKHSELIPVPLARRILRTKRTLVLPAHINLTIITNSYDVVHS